MGAYFSARITEEQFRELKRIAEEEGVAPSCLLREAVERWRFAPSPPPPYPAFVTVWVRERKVIEKIERAENKSALIRSALSGYLRERKKRKGTRFLGRILSLLRSVLRKQ